MDVLQRTSLMFLLTKSSDWESYDFKTEYIPISLCAYEEWKPTRTENLLLAYKPDMDFDPIQVVGLRIIGEDKIYYDICDGNHRCYVHELKNKPLIKAEIKGVYTVNPDQFVIHNHELWTIEDEMLLMVSELEPEQTKALISLGVRVK